MYFTVDLPVNAPALWEAAYRGDLHCVKSLLCNGADYRERASINQCTALHVAALHGHKDIVYELIRAAQPRRYTYNGLNFCNVMDEEGLTPLHYACCMLMIEVCEMLIRFGAATSTEGCQYSQPVLYAACGRDYRHTDGMYGGMYNECPHDEKDRIRRMQLQMVQLLLENGADVSSCEWSGHGMMIWELAIESHNDTALLRLLLNAVAVTGKSIPVSRSGDTIMHHVANLNHFLSRDRADIKMLDMLRRHARKTRNKTLDISTQNHKGNTTLYAACDRDKVDMVRYLLDAGVDPPATRDSLDNLETASSVEIWAMIVAEFNGREPRNIAFAMATHPRLNELSRWRSLPLEVHREVEKHSGRALTWDRTKYES